jgi:hypothetical protein
VVTKERQALEVEVEAHTNTQASVNKAVRNLNKVHNTPQPQHRDKERPLNLMDWC